MNIQQLIEHKNFLIQYLLSKVDSEDWHAVSDAANDIREIEREIKVKREFEER